MRQNFFILLFAVMVMLTGCQSSVNKLETVINTEKNEDSSSLGNESEFLTESETAINAEKNEDSSLSNESKFLTVNYINVGQADSILIQSSDGKNMLIDAGETIDNAVVNYIDGLGIKKLDAVIATHPHSDHISEMANVINKYEIGTFYMPNAEHTTRTYERMIEALENKNVNVIPAAGGTEVNFGNETECMFVAPCSGFYDDLNNYSAVLRLTYGNTSFLFTGDAEQISENEILSNGFDIAADVLKIGHHGSHTSTSDEFLDKVSPKIAVISCGIDNEYGHPHKETIAKLNEREITTYITRDAEKAVIIKSDGEKIYKDENVINNNMDKGTSSSESEVEEKNEFIGNINSKILHSSECESLPKEKNRVYFSNLQEGINEGYKPHSCIN